jgi:epoxyqueuosine reductase
MSCHPSRREFLQQIAAAGVLMCLGRSAALGRQQGEGGGTVGLGLGVDFTWRAVPVSRLAELRDDLARVDRTGQVSDNEIFRGYLAGFAFSPPEDFPGARSVIVLAVRDDPLEIVFQHRGVRHVVPVPPGYSYLRTPQGAVEEAVRRDVLGDPEARIEPVKLPVKLLAARCGLARYGRNNITFVDGMGSYHALRGFYTDRSFPAGEWHPARLLRQCKGCDVCIRRCPTGCIAQDRFVIDVGRCVTLYNERSEPIPDWVDPAAHNALVGCLRCQAPCPVNLEHAGRTERLAEIDEEETAMLLEGGKDARLKASVEEKLARFGLVGDLAHLGRNLRLVLEASPPAGGDGARAPEHPAGDRSPARS